jgi:hypothetical protein
MYLSSLTLRLEALIVSEVRYTNHESEELETLSCSDQVFPTRSLKVGVGTGKERPFDPLSLFVGSEILLTCLSAIAGECHQL